MRTRAAPQPRQTVARWRITSLHLSAGSSYDPDLAGDIPAPVRHQVVEIPPFQPVVIKHQLQRLVCPCCCTVITPVLPEGHGDNTSKESTPVLSAAALS